MADQNSLEASRKNLQKMLDRIESNVKIITDDELSREDGQTFLQSELALGYPYIVTFSKGALNNLLDSGIIDVVDAELAAKLRALRILIREYDFYREGNYNVVVNIVSHFLPTLPFPTSIFAEPPLADFLWSMTDDDKIMFFLNAYLSVKRMSIQINLNYYSKIEEKFTEILERLDAHL